MRKVLFLAKHKPFAEDAAELVKQHIDNAEIIFGNLHAPFPAHLLNKNMTMLFHISLHVLFQNMSWITQK